MQALIIPIAGIIAVGIGLFVLIRALRIMSVDEVSTRLDEYVSEQSPQSEKISQLFILQTREFSGSLRSRLIIPTLHRIGGLFGRMTPASQVDQIDHMLLLAGNPSGIGPREFFGFRIALLFIGSISVYFIILQGIDLITGLLSLLILIISFYLPTYWLRRRIATRQMNIRAGLPDALDMLSVCTSAGLGFDQAMQRVSENWENPISIEFGRVMTEMEMGLSRREALRNMADRVEVSELSSFVSFILQSEQLGMSIVDTLQAQADQLRVERRFRALEQVQKIPVKMLVPMAFLIFPAIIAVVIGPSIPALVDLFSNF